MAEKKKSGGKAGQKRKRYNVGVIVAERYLREERSFYWQVYQELSIYASEIKVFLLLEVIEAEQEAALEVPNLLQQDKVDGLIIFGPFSSLYLRKLMEQILVPVVSLDSRYEDVWGDAVMADNVSGSYLMTKYLLELGHREIGFVGTLQVTPSIDNRFLGFVKALRYYGLQPEDAWIVEDRDRNLGMVGVEGTFLLPEGRMPTAFFCNCDFSAKLLIEKLQKCNYSVPEDISVVGFDDYLVEQGEVPGITTYGVDVLEMSKTALKLLLERVEEPEQAEKIVLIRGRLIERESAARAKV